MALLTAALVLDLGILAVEARQARGPLDPLPALLALPVLAAAGLLGWQLLAAVRAADRREVFHRLDAEGAQVFPLVGGPRSVPWDGLRQIRPANGGILLSGRSASGGRTGFFLTFPAERRAEVLAVLRHYRPDLSAEPGSS